MRQRHSGGCELARRAPQFEVWLGLRALATKRRNSPLSVVSTGLPACRPNTGRREKSASIGIPFWLRPEPTVPNLIHRRYRQRFGVAHRRRAARKVRQEADTVAREWYRDCASPAGHLRLGSPNRSLLHPGRSGTSDTSKKLR